MNSGHDELALTAQTDQSGDYAAFETELIRLIPFLKAHASALSGRREFAEDLAQEALAKAWGARGSFKADTNLKAWLFTILRNEFYSRHRRAWRQVSCSSEFAESVPTAIDGQHWSAVLSDATRALHCLPVEQRRALLLIGAGGFSYDEVAALSGAAPGTVKSRVARGRKSLGKILERAVAMPKKYRPAPGDAANEILAQVDQMSRGATPRASVGAR